MNTLKSSLFTNVKVLVRVVLGNAFAIIRMAAEIFWYGLKPRSPTAFLRRVKKMAIGLASFYYLHK
jgi:hypothetical protein